MVKAQLNEHEQLIVLKKDFAKFTHDLKIEHIKAQFTKQTSVLGLKELIKKDKISTTELKALWKNGSKIGK